LSKDFDLEFERLLQESARVAAEFDASEEDQNSDQSQELSERHALRRVQGFSTELQDIS
jgi:GTP-binding protein HflX